MKVNQSNLMLISPIAVFKTSKLPLHVPSRAVPDLGQLTLQLNLIRGVVLDAGAGAGEFIAPDLGPEPCDGELFLAIESDRSS